MTPKRSTSPFSGMDPYLEEPAFWPAFHRQLVACLHSHLLPNLVDRYSSVSGNRHYTTGTTEHQEDYLEVRQRSNGPTYNPARRGQPRQQDNSCWT